MDEWDIPQSKVYCDAYRATCVLESDDDGDVDNSTDWDGDTVPNVTSLMVDYEQHEVDHELSFYSNRVSCFSHTLKLVVQRFDLYSSSKP